MSLLNSALLGVGFSSLALACAAAGCKPGQVQDNPDDYTVHDGDRTVGRIFKASAAHPDGRPGMWTVEHHERQGRPGPHQGIPDLESAMMAAGGCTPMDSGAYYNQSGLDRQHRIANPN
jgi:hypothetical protein